MADVAAASSSVAKHASEAGPASQSPPQLLDRFSAFLADDFNVAAFTSNALGSASTTASAQSEELRNGVQLLDAAIAGEVVTHDRELLHHLRRMLDAENSVRDVVLSVDALQSAVRRIRAEVVGPYDLIKQRTQQLRNVHTTVEMLRHVIHRLKLAQKLRSQLAVPPAQLDLAKAAKLITDIRQVGFSERPKRCPPRCLFDVRPHSPSWGPLHPPDRHRTRAYKYLLASESWHPSSCQGQCAPRAPALCLARLEP
jgi:hypothetical protein